MTPFPLSFLAQIMQGALFQPATNYWRAIELTVLIEKGLPFLKEARAIFDLGCGDGEIMRLLRPHLPAQATLRGMDIDPAETAMAAQSGVYTQVLCGSADSVPLPSESQDAIISNSVLEHVAPIEGVLRESGRLLKQGGWFVATVPAPDFHACLKGSWKRGVTHDNYCGEIDKRLVHHRYWTRKEWTAQLALAGITLIDCIPYLSKEETRRWEFLSRITGGLLYHLTKGRKRPIAIQRQLGVRKSMKAPLWLAQFVAWGVTLGSRDEKDTVHASPLPNPPREGEGIIAPHVKDIALDNRKSGSEEINWRQKLCGPLPLAGRVREGGSKRCASTQAERLHACFLVIGRKA